MRAGFVQSNPRLLDVEGNVDRILKFLERVKSFDLMVLPELFNTGYNFKSRREVERVSEKIPGGYTTQKLREVAEEKGACIVGGLAEKAGGGLYNSAVVVTAEHVGVYRKTHLFNNEKKFFKPGDTGFKVFKFKGVKIGVMICFDWLYPESARTLALKGADVIAHPANLVLLYCPDAMKTRSLENRVYTITADRVGVERGLKYMGLSQITDTRGGILYRASENKEEFKVVEINPKDARDKKINEYNNILRDRRPDQYRP